jgi:hypothetical protein
MTNKIKTIDDGDILKMMWEVNGIKVRSKTTGHHSSSSSISSTSSSKSPKEKLQHTSTRSRTSHRQGPTSAEFEDMIKAVKERVQHSVRQSRNPSLRSEAVFRHDKPTKDMLRSPAIVADASVVDSSVKQTDTSTQSSVSTIAAKLHEISVTNLHRLRHYNINVYYEQDDGEEVEAEATVTEAAAAAEEEEVREA